MKRTAFLVACAVVFTAGIYAAAASYFGWFWHGLDKERLHSFTQTLPRKARAADVVIVGERVMTLGSGKVVSLYRILEIIKGKDLIRRVMAAYPEVKDALFVAYDSPTSLSKHYEPEGKTLIFMTAPREAGKNFRLLESGVEEGMIYAVPPVVRETRTLCRSESAGAVTSSGVAER